MRADRIQSRLLLQSSLSTGLGTVSVAGFVRDSRGVSLVNKRIFGRYALVYLLKGSGRMQVEKYPIIKCRPGDLIFVYPEIPHGYGPGQGESWTEFYVVFSGPVFDLWRHQRLLNPDRPVHHLPRISHWLPQLEAIASGRIPDTPEGMLQRVCLLQKFLCDITEKQPQPAGQLPWIDEAMARLVNSHGPSPRAIARDLGISYETFRKNFSHATGHAPGQYRAIRLIDQARSLIEERGMSNKEIAETLGFYDEFHFSRRFRQIAGKSTREFRRNLFRQNQ